MRERAMERTREKLQKLQERVASGKLVDAAKIGAAAERALQAHHGCRYYTWRMTRGAFQFEESPLHFEREKRLEGKYVIATSEASLGVVEAVSMYKELMEVERGFRQMKDVLAMRPIWHRVAPRVRAHIFVAALALLLSRLLERRLKEAGVDLSGSEAFQAVSTIRVVDFRLSGPPGTTSARRGVSTGSPRARQVLKALGVTELKPPPAPPDEPTVT
jgi:transposase